MMEVGIRELRDGLSKHLTLVRAGQVVTITDHGKPVARITPIGVPAPFERLVAEGRVTPGRRTTRPQPSAVGRVSDLVTEQRR